MSAAGNRADLIAAYLAYAAVPRSRVTEQRILAAADRLLTPAA